MSGMNPRQQQRQKLDLTQTDAATQAGMSLATWRRWEEDPDKVSAQTRARCESLVERLTARGVTYDRQFEAAWGDSSVLTPRQAAAISSCLEDWIPLDLDSWLLRETTARLHEMPLLTGLDLRVMILINENPAWVAAARDRCRAVGAEIKEGTLPFDRPGCFFDEVMMGLVLGYAKDLATDTPDMFDGVAVRGEEGHPDEVLDDDWAMLIDLFDQHARWEKWEIAITPGHPLTPLLLRNQPPYTWFDHQDGSTVGGRTRAA